MTEALFYEVVKQVSFNDDDATVDSENIPSDR
jgi:hypothetical protein